MYINKWLYDIKKSLGDYPFANPYPFINHLSSFTKYRKEFIDV